MLFRARDSKYLLQAQLGTLQASLNAATSARANILAKVQHARICALDGCPVNDYNPVPCLLQS